MSFVLDQSIAYYLICNGLDVSRAIFGPLPLKMCQFNIFAKNMIHINTSLLCMAISGTKFAFIVVYRQIPEIDDNFISAYIYMVTNLVSVISTFIILYLPGKPVINQVNS